MPIPSVVTSSATCSLLIQAPCDSSRLLDAVALSWCSARWFSCVIMTRYRPRLEYSCQTDTGCFASCGGSSFGLWFQQASLCSPCWRFMVSLLWPGPSESASFFFFLFILPAIFKCSPGVHLSFSCWLQPGVCQNVSFRRSRKGHLCMQ